MQLVLRGHKTKREADYGSKKIGYSLSQKKREKKGSKAQERPKSLSPRLCVGQLCTPRLAKTPQFVETISEWAFWYPKTSELLNNVMKTVFLFGKALDMAQKLEFCCEKLFLVSPKTFEIHKWNWISKTLIENSEVIRWQYLLRINKPIITDW